MAGGVLAVFLTACHPARVETFPPPNAVPALPATSSSSEKPAALFGYRALAAKAGLAAVPSKARWVLERPEHAALFRIDPAQGDEKAGFRGYRVLAQRALDHDGPIELANTIAVGVGIGGAQMRCFEPGYAARFTRAGTTLDVALCFDCLLVRFYPTSASGTELDLSLGHEILPDLQQLETAP